MKKNLGQGIQPPTGLQIKTENLGIIMNQLKRILGVVWMLLAPLAVFYLVKTAIQEIQRNPAIDTKIQWAVFVIVFVPIAIGLVIFGYYAVKGEYDRLPESSEEIQ